MKEFRGIFKVHAVHLKRHDLFELERLLKQELQYKMAKIDDFAIAVTCGTTRIEAHSVDELLRHDLPDYTDAMTASLNGWNAQSKIDKTISVTMHHNFIDFQIASTSEEWFLGKSAQLNNFFAARKPWYAGLKNALPPLTPMITMLATLLVLLSLFAEKYWLIPFPIILILTSVKVMSDSLNQKLFPYVRIELTDHPKPRLSYETYTLIIALLALLVSIIGSIIIPVHTMR